MLWGNISYLIEYVKKASFTTAPNTGVPYLSDEQGSVKVPFEAAKSSILSL